MEEILNLYLFGEIKTESVRPIIEDIVKAQNESYKEINLYINSEGGSVTDAFALADVILDSNKTVNTICTGLVCSAATLIYLAGYHRYAYKHGTFVFHNTSSDVSDMTKDNLIEYNKWLDKLEEWELELYENTVGNKFLADILNSNKEVRLTTDEAFNLGIVSEVI